MQTVQLDIIADPICPWCHMGQIWLREGLKSAGQNPFDIHWRTFFLNPDMPREGMPRDAYLEAKFGTEAAARAHDQLEELANASGDTLNFAKIQRTPNTLDAHRLLRWARADGVQNQIAELLFTSYFQLGLDISDRETLLGLAEHVGMDREVIARLLSSDTDIAHVEAEDEGFRKMGVTGVPTFVVNGQHVVTGAQPAEFWTQVAADVAAQL